MNNKTHEQMVAEFLENNKEQQTELTPNKKEWLTPREVANEFGFSKNALARWRMENKNLPFFKLGGRYRSD